MEDLAIPPSPEWKCIRCGFVLPSPDESGRSPNACLASVGGCGRGVDDDESPTRFFPSDWSGAKTELYIQADLNEGARLFRDIVAEGERLFEFKNPWHPRMCALYVFQTFFFRTLYPIVFYLSFHSGQHGAAKTTATRWVTELSDGGVMVGGLTVPYLERMMDQGAVLGIDEVDALPTDLKTMVEKGLRHGYERGAISGKVEDDGKKGKKPRGFNIFSPKAFNFRGKPEDALMARAYVIEMVRVKDEDVVRRVGDNLVRLLVGSGDMVPRLINYREKALKEWSRERVISTLMDESFRLEVESYRQSGYTPRDVQLSYICLLTAKIAGVDVGKEIREAFAASSEYHADDEIEEMFHHLAEVWEGESRPPYITMSKLRTLVNERRSKAKDPTYSPQVFPRVLSRAGLVDEIRRVPHDGHKAVYFTDSLLKLIYPKDEGAIKSVLSFTRPFTEGGSEVKDKAATFTETLHPGEGTVDLVKLLRGRGEIHSRRSKDGCFAPVDLGERCQDESPEAPIIEKDRIEKFIKRWLDEGVLFEKSFGRYRFV